MARTIPSPTSGRTIPAAAPAAGGGGGGNAVEWVDLSLDPTDSAWTVLGASASKTIALVGGKLEVDLSAPANYKIQGSTNNGINLVSTLPISPWSNHSDGTPAGTADHTIQPESVLIKLEVQFDRAVGPVNGPVADSYGLNMMVCAGFTSYGGDQAGSPAIGGAGVDWRGAYARKFIGGDPAASTALNLYQAGCRTYWTNLSGDTGDVLWSNQNTAGATAHDSIVFTYMPLRRTNTGVTSKSQMMGGSYCRGDKFGQNAPTYGFTDNSGVLSNSSGSTNNNYFHFWIGFGSTHNFAGGTFTVTKIRYAIQPLASRVPV